MVIDGVTIPNNPQQGAWYSGRQYWNGTLSAPGQINTQSNQVGAGQQVSRGVVAQTNPANVAYLQQQQALQQTQPQQMQYQVPQPVQQTTAGQAAQMAQPVSSPNWQDVVSQATQMYQQAAQPQVTALEAQKPQAETRYQQLLNDITRQTTQAKSAEYSRRGIPLSSGAYETDIARTNVPLIAQAGQIREDSLANIANQIAQAQSGALTGGIQTGMNLYGTQVQQGESAASRAIQLQQLQQQQQQAQAEQAWKQKVYGETTLPESQAAVQKAMREVGNIADESSTLSQIFPNMSTPYGPAYAAPNGQQVIFNQVPRYSLVP